jgi:tetratricopeptide (TPR) repeat protein
MLVDAGLAEHRAGRSDAAQRLYERALACDPACAAALHYLGVLAMGRDDCSSAALLMDRALALAPDDAHCLSNRGIVAARLNDQSGAATFQRKAIDQLPDFANAHNNLGNALMELGEADDAQHHYRRARWIRTRRNLPSIWAARWKKRDAPTRRLPNIARRKRLARTTRLRS